jgi:predicted dehydrogenase
MITLALVGAGLRGQTYARLATASGRARVVAVAEADSLTHFAADR